MRISLQRHRLTQCRNLVMTKFICKSLWIAGRARFNAPDLKSDVRSNVPGVRIPRYPPYIKKTHIIVGFFMAKK